MRQYTRLGFALAASLTLGALVTPHAPVRAAMQQPAAMQVVTTYQQALTDGMKSGDLSAVVALYAPDAIVTFSTPGGMTTVFHGRPAIAGFYRRLHQMVPGFHWAQDSTRMLGPTVVLSYEHPVTPGGQSAGHCAHLFVTQGAQIESLDWVVYRQVVAHKL